MSRFTSYDNSTRINYPENIKVQEHKAPTDDSIRLMEEMQEKTIKNILAKVKVTDNIVDGEIYLMRSGWHTTLDYHKIYCKFKINNQEFTLEDEIHTQDVFCDDKINQCKSYLQDEGKAIMLWYVMEKFKQVAFQKITGKQVPDTFIK